mgnify:CR=1 FL=1
MIRPQNESSIRNSTSYPASIKSTTRSLSMQLITFKDILIWWNKSRSTLMKSKERSLFGTMDLESQSESTKRKKTFGFLNWYLVTCSHQAIMMIPKRKQLEVGMDMELSLLTSTLLTFRLKLMILQDSYTTSKFGKTTWVLRKKPKFKKKQRWKTSLVSPLDLIYQSLKWQNLMKTTLLFSLNEHMTWLEL